MKIKSLVSTVVLGVTALLVVGCTTKTPDNWVVKVNKTAITQDDMNLRWLNVSPEVQKTISNPVNYVLNDLVRSEMFYQEAKKKNMEDSKEYKDFIKRLTSQYEYQKKQALVDLYLRENVDSKIKIADQEVTSAYDANKSRFFSGFEQRSFSHILVKDRSTATQILEDLKRGVSYDSLAKTKSIDGNSAKNGGRLPGYYRRDVLNPVVANVVFSMKSEGEISSAIQTQAGFHIIRLDDVQQIGPRSFEQVKQYLTQQLYLKKRNDELSKLYTSIKDNYKQEINPKNQAKPEDKKEEADKKG
jgi:peptidyl-prolyl cis-trans isomerase C